MKKYYKTTFKRNDNQNLFLFSLKKHKQKNTKELEITHSSGPHMRWHPFRQEWVTYSSGRENRTSFPAKKYCPFCPSGKLSYTTEIPFKNFEIAVLPNRWPSFSTHNDNIPKLDGLITKPSNGNCEVVVYSPNHNDTLTDMPIEKIELLVHTWINRYKELSIKDDIKYVMPFENRGELCGVTLHHPHGQIYSYPFIPPVIQKEIKAFKEKNYLLSLMDSLEKKYFVYQDEHIIAAVPPFARYAYEIWIIPKVRVAGPWEFNDGQLNSFSICLQKVVRCYDNLLKKKCPYIMGLHAAPTLKDKSFHFHAEFYPPLRSINKPKILAGSESMAGVFIMDVLPEETALILREHIN